MIEDSVDSHELSEWIAYWSLEPPHDPYGHTALLCSVIASVMGTKQYHPRDFDPRPDLTDSDPASNPEIQRDLLSAFAAAFNARLNS